MVEIQWNESTISIRCKAQKWNSKQNKNTKHEKTSQSPLPAFHLSVQMESYFGPTFPCIGPISFHFQLPFGFFGVAIPFDQDLWTQQQAFPSWWLNQPIWKICSSNWIMKTPRFGVKIPKNLWNHHLPVVSNKTTEYRCIDLLLRQILNGFLQELSAAAHHYNTSRVQRVGGKAIQRPRASPGNGGICPLKN